MQSIIYLLLLAVIKDQGSAFGRIAYEHENEVRDNEVQNP